MNPILTASLRLRDEVDALPFGPPVSFVYNPLRYAWDAHAEYVRRYSSRGARVLLVGMNPGPFGMAQTGVPFGDVVAVRDWMGIDVPVGRPDREHAKRPVLGFASTRREGSGKRLWGWAADRLGTADAFFDRFFVHNYCPLLFLHESGRNLTPDALSVQDREPLLDPCDAALRALVDALSPEFVLGVGVFAERRAQAALSDSQVIIGRILHPSPASPLANRDWAGQIETQLKDLGIEL